MHIAEYYSILEIADSLYTYFFYKNTRIIFAYNLRTILDSAEKQILKFSI